MRRLSFRERLKLALPILIALGLLCAGALFCWFNPDMRDAFKQALGIEVHRTVKPVGYYGQAIPVTQDLGDVAQIAEDDAAAARYESNIPIVESPLASTLEIDGMLTGELEGGDYDFHDPMVIQDAFGNSPLTALALFTTPEAQRVRCTVKGKTPAADIRYETPAQTAHRVPLIGLYPAAENAVELALLDAEGNVTDTAALTVQTGGLPDRMNGMVEPVVCAGESAYGLTMVYGQSCKRPFAIDCNGDIRWYLDQETGYYGLYNLSDGRFLLQDASSYTMSVSKPQTVKLYEMDYLGRAYQVYYLPYGSHHDVVEKTPGGNLMCLTSSMEEHYEDVITELDRATGQSVNTLKLSDLFLNTYTRKLDWAHINTVSWQSEDDTIIISPRNLHSVMKIGWTDHKLKWILCDPYFWKDTRYKDQVLKPEGDILWHYQQHTAYRVEADLDQDPDTIEISVFDNHVDAQRKIDTFTDTGLSYATVYSVNEKDMTVRVIKQLEVLQSNVCSNTVYDPDSGRIFAMSGIIPEDAHHGYLGMIYEFDYESGDIVNQFAIQKQFYRATQLPLKVDPICEPIAAGSIVGALPRPQAVKADVPEPVGTLSEEVVLTRTGSALFVSALNRSVSQVIFAGREHTYVYDNTGVKLESENYLDFTANMPVALQDLEPDEYSLLCVYRDALYKLTADGGEAYINVTAP